MRAAGRYHDGGLAKIIVAALSAVKSATCQQPYSWRRHSGEIVAFIYGDDNFKLYLPNSACAYMLIKAFDLHRISRPLIYVCLLFAIIIIFMQIMACMIYRIFISYQSGSHLINRLTCGER